MKNGYYTLSDRVDVEGKRFSDPEFVKTLMTGVTSKASMIDAIENYNESHKLNEKERIKYSIGLGEIYVNVIHAYKLGGNSSTTYAIIGRDNNGYGILNKSGDASVSNTFDTAISTHIIDVADITDVWIAGYDSSKIGNILGEFSGTEENPISSRELEKILTDLKTELNGLLSTGEYRMFFNKFTYVMKSKKLNEVSYENKTTAYNIYTSIWVNYISTIKNILANFAEMGINNIDFDKIRFGAVSNLYFVEAEDEAGIKAVLENKVKEVYTSTPLNQDRLEDLVEKAFRRTFSTSDIDTFKAIVAGTDDQNP